MGLPIFITPVEPEVAAKATDKTASVPRSSIRRHRTIRPPNGRVATAELRRRRLLGLAGDGNAEDYELWEGPPRGASNEGDGDVPSVASLQARAHHMFEDESSRLRDPLSFERQQPLSAMDGLPTPEFRGQLERQRELVRLRQVRHDLRRLGRRQPAPTPPYTETDPGASLPDESLRTSSLTPGLSPARVSPRSSSEILELDDTQQRRTLEDGETSFTFGQQPSARPTLSERVQSIITRPAEAVSERPRGLHRIRYVRMDGLGDRDRSLSPEGALTWDTLLTSITPDPQPPSAGSSFASAAAANSSTSSGPASASTSMTSLGPVENSAALRDCDLSDSASNTEEDEEDMYELQEFRRDRYHARTYADALTVRTERAVQHSGTRDAEHLGGMHRIISRLAERDEIPDEWWASAGLSRNLRREPAA